MSRAAVCLALLLVLAGCTGGIDVGDRNGDRGTAVLGSSTRVTVTSVVDGDTVKVRLPNGTTDTVRLLGVDTPETHAENEPAEFEGVPATAAGRDCLRAAGHDATRYLTERVLGETVTLEFDSRADRRGYYGRLLAYVVHDGRDLNYRLVATGHARVFDSTFSRADRYYAAEERARTNGTALWQCVDPDTASGTRTVTPSESGLVVSVHADAAGPDGENLNDEYVVLENRGDRTLAVSGWTVADAADHVYTFGDVTLAPGATVTLHTGSGTDTDTDRYWGRCSPVWNNDGDTATVRAANGSVVARHTYAG